MSQRGSPAVGPILAFVLARCGELLNWDVVRPEDNFFELGGDSLAATELLVACEEQFGVQPDLRLLFDAADLRAFAQAISVSSGLSEGGTGRA